jgi:hypothetical protein
MFSDECPEAQEGGATRAAARGAGPGGGARQGVMGVRRQGCRQANGELVVVCGGWRVEKM